MRGLSCAHGAHAQLTCISFVHGQFVHMALMLSFASADVRDALAWLLHVMDSG